ncbi:hypothetical protein ACHAXT_004655 [Thalassiosira profunda]
MLVNDLDVMAEEMVLLLKRLADVHSTNKKRIIFMINNLDSIITIFKERRVSGRELNRFSELLVQQRELFVEEELLQTFSKMIAFVQQTETHMSGISAPRGARGVAAPADVVNPEVVESLVHEFASNWKSGIEQINRNVLSYFSNFRNGMEILKQVLTQLLLYYTRFQDVIRKVWRGKASQFLQGSGQHFPHATMNSHRCALLVVAAALSHSTAAFAPALAPSCTSTCRSSTEASLFPWRKNKIDADEAGSSSEPEAPVEEEPLQSQNSRRSFLSATKQSARSLAATAATASLLSGRSAPASAAGDKQLNLSNDELKKIITSDLLDNDFLVSGQITRSIYDESATFTDEIDTYTMDKWIKGTQSLFIASGSRLSLVGDIDVTDKEVTLRFDEDLMFNIPFKPVCSLTGKLVLTRDPSTGLITSYREFWDQSVNEVLKTAKFRKQA